MRKSLGFISLSLIAVMPLGLGNANNPACRPASAMLLPGEYPEHPLSPKESLRTFDTVFYGEVVVPTRKCSLGFCAGLRLLRPVKGQPGGTVLVRLSAPTTVNCGPALFTDKGKRWMVFANQGTSHGGQRYVDSGDDGPSFIANEMPDFNRLEGTYQMTKAHLDQAIEDRLGHWR